MAALIGVLLSLQALIGGFGTGAMAFASSEQAVICSSGSAQPDHHATHGGLGKKSHGPLKGDCCLTACQIAASFHAGIPGKPPIPAVLTQARSGTVSAVPEIDLPPQQLAANRAARGPPVFSI